MLDQNVYCLSGFYGWYCQSGCLNNLKIYLTELTEGTCKCQGKMVYNEKHVKVMRKCQKGFK